ncbi:MAG: hypothetical protein AB2693_26385, partial [Candidatus Thiodiazotropha sp.]
LQMLMHEKPCLIPILLVFNNWALISYLTVWVYRRDLASQNKKKVARIAGQPQKGAWYGFYRTSDLSLVESASLRKICQTSTTLGRGKQAITRPVPV